MTEFAKAVNMAAAIEAIAAKVERLLSASHEPSHEPAETAPQVTGSQPNGTPADLA